MTNLDEYMNRKAAVLAERHRELVDKPGTGVAELTVKSHVAGITGLRPVTMGQYTVVTDSGPALAGHSLGPSSPEMLLGALASCLTHTYVLQAALHDIQLDHVEVDVSGTLDMADAVNPDNQKTIAIENISYHANVQSTQDSNRLEELDDLVQMGCAVLNTIRHSQEVRKR